MTRIHPSSDDDDRSTSDELEQQTDANDAEETLDDAADAVAVPEDLDALDDQADELDPPPDSVPPPGAAPPISDALAAEILADHPSEPPRPKFDVTQVPTDAAGRPQEIRIVVEFRGLPAELPGDSRADENVSSPSESADEAAGETDPAAADASASTDAPQSEPGDSTRPAEPRATTGLPPDVLKQLLAVVMSEREKIEGIAMPVTLTVTPSNTETIIKNAIDESGPHWMKKLSEVAQYKCDDLLYFLWTEQRRLDPDLR